MSPLLRTFGRCKQNVLSVPATKGRPNETKMNPKKDDELAGKEKPGGASYASVREQALLDLSIVRIQRQMALVPTLKTRHGFDTGPARGLGLSPESLALITSPRVKPVFLSKKPQCRHCGVIVANKKLLLQHLLDCHPDAFRGSKLSEFAARERCFCRACGDAGETREFLTTAARKRHAEFSCPHRTPTGKRKSLCVPAVRKKKRKRTLYECPRAECTWSTEHKTRLAKHISKQHTPRRD
jgi:hypothetical protein